MKDGKLYADVIQHPIQIAQKTVVAVVKYMAGVESYTQKVVLGFLILGAVLLDMLKKRKQRTAA